MAPYTEEFRPVIGIPAYEHACDDMLGKQSSAVPHSYLYALSLVGVTPLIIPAVNDPKALKHLSTLMDGLMLIGGPDIDPAHYGQPRRKGLRLVTPERDAVELWLTRWALRKRLPILAICRGIQLLNVAADGSLVQDIGLEVPGAQKHDQYPDFAEDHLAHEVSVAPESRLGRICGQLKVTVNSLHHQSIDRVGKGLRVVARSEDRIIEAVEGEGGGWVVGVQWHPEWLIDGGGKMLRLFGAFAEACRAAPSKNELS